MGEIRPRRHGASICPTVDARHLHVSPRTLAADGYVTRTVTRLPARRPQRIRENPMLVDPWRPVTRCSAGFTLMGVSSEAKFGATGMPLTSRTFFEEEPGVEIRDI